jgi:antitoxin PrlF
MIACVVHIGSSWNAPQAWFFTPQWLAGEREAYEEISAGRGTAHESADEMFAHLDSLAADT